MDIWLSSLATLALFFGVIILIWQILIDLKLRLLPDELNIALFAFGLLFRFASDPYSGGWTDAALGVLMGGGVLYLIRAVANRAYGFETMGLGDVKLMAAAGIWLGIDGVLYALIAGAVFGLLHGVLLVTIARLQGHKNIGLRNLTIPAGPGFCAGIILVAAWKFHALPLFS